MKKLFFLMAAMMITINIKAQERLNIEEDEEERVNVDYSYDEKTKTLYYDGTCTRYTCRDLWYKTRILKLGPHANFEPGDNFFWRLSSLERIIVDAKNPDLTSVNGILMNKEKTVLHIYPKKKAKVGKYRIPTSIQTIEKYAFDDANIDTLVITSGLKKLKGGLYSSNIKKFIIENNSTFFIKYNTLCTYNEKITIPSGSNYDAYSYYCPKILEPKRISSEFLMNNVLSVYSHADKSCHYVYRSNKPAVIIMTRRDCWPMGAQTYYRMLTSIAKTYKNRINVYIWYYDADPNGEEIWKRFNYYNTPVTLFVNGEKNGEVTYFQVSKGVYLTDYALQIFSEEMRNIANQ